MLRSINDIVCQLNDSFTVLPEGSIVGAIAYTMLRTDSENTRIPVITDKDFEGVNLVPDDTVPVILYHKISSVTTKRNPQEAGRSLGVVNTYNMQMIVFLNKKKVNWVSDELFLYLQAILPDTLKNDIKPFFSVLVTVTSANFNDFQVWAQEYANAFPLKPEHSLFLINYSVETSFKKDCFSSCLEETETN